MVPSADNWKAIMTAMTCLCASKQNGIDNNFITELTNALNYQYPNETRIFITSAELQQIETKISYLEKSFEKLQSQQIKLLAEIKKIKTPSFCPESKTPIDPNQYIIRDINVPEINSSLNVVCNGDWLVVLMRFDGGVNFYRFWQDYKLGFGKPDTEFFIGLEKLHILTKAKRYELKIRFIDFDDEERIATYDRFEIGSEAEAYSLKVLGSYSGNAGDSLSVHRGRKFSTKDHDNDLNHYASCAELSGGAWWYADEPCHESNLFGHYSAIPEQRNGRGIVWKSFHGLDYSLKEVVMLIRPSKNCC